MSMLLARAGMLCALDCYEHRAQLKRAGAAFDRKTRMWVMPLTIANFETMLAAVPNPIIEASLEQAFKEQQQKEERLREITELSKRDAPIQLRVRGITKVLYNYQKLGVKYFLANGECCLIADEMGLGKTVIGLACGCYLRYERGQKSCLIVVPAAVKWNWPLEIEKFTNEPYVVIDGSPEERVKQWRGVYTCRRKQNGKYRYTEKEGAPYFYVVNYELLTQDLFGGKKITVKDDDSIEVATRKVKQINKAKHREAVLSPIRERAWGCIILDEAHYIKTFNSARTKHVRELKGLFRIALTGTPLDGRLEELHSVMAFVKPGLFAARLRFLQRHAEFDYWGRVKKYKHIDEVRKRIEPFFIRRLKKDVLAELPDKTYVNKFVTLSPREMKAYKAIAKREHPCSEDSEAMVRVIRCKQFCDHPELVEEDMPSSKMAVFLALVEELILYGGQKAIVFSQYKQMLNIIDRELRHLGLTFLRVDGDTPSRERAAMQETFNTNPKYDAIIGTEALSTGLNLTGATYVVNYDDNWAPAIMRQREDRAHRTGQKNAVTVVNFIVRDTIEERIRKVLYGKELVSTEVLGDDTDEAVLRRLSPMEIQKLL